MTKETIPVVLGAVAGAADDETEALTGTGCGTNCCDMSTDYAKCEGEISGC